MNPQVVGNSLSLLLDTSQLPSCYKVTFRTITQIYAYILVAWPLANLLYSHMAHASDCDPSTQLQPKCPVRSDVRAEQMGLLNPI